jgi:hypothetical protein
MKTNNMKRIIFIAFCAVAAGCGELDKQTLSDSPKAPVLRAVENIEMTEANLSSNVVFRWSSADFGCAVVVDYELFAQAAGGTKQSLGVSHSDSLSLNLRDVNCAVHRSMGDDFDFAPNVSFSIRASLGSGSAITSASSTAQVIVSFDDSCYGE